MSQAERVSRWCVCVRTPDGTVRPCAWHSAHPETGYPACETCGDRGFILRRQPERCPEGCVSEKSIPDCSCCLRPVFNRKLYNGKCLNCAMQC